MGILNNKEFIKDVKELIALYKQIGMDQSSINALEVMVKELAKQDERLKVLTKQLKFQVLEKSKDDKIN